MSWFLEKISEFRGLIYIQTPEGEIQVSRHKAMTLVCYVSAFFLTFYHFSTIPAEVISDIQLGIIDSIPSSRSLGISMLIYLYITLVAFISVFKGGNLPNFLSRPRLPDIRRRYQVTLILFVFLFSSLVVFMFILSLYFSSVLLIYTGPVLFIIWTVLEPFFLLSGIMAIIRIIDADYSLEGFTSKSKKILLGIFILGYIAPIFFLIFLLPFYTGDVFSEITIIGNTFSFYLPALRSFSESFSSVLSITILFLVVWWIKDRFRGPSTIREKKKGMLPWYLGLTLIFIIITVVPLITTTSGSLQELSSILDILGLITAVFMGLWNALGVEQSTTPITGLQRLNLIKLIDRIHPYSKALFLFVLSLFAFYSSLENSTMAFITGQLNAQKLQELELLASLVGLAYLVLLWRYKGQPRSATPGILKSTQQQLEIGLRKAKSTFIREEVLDQKEIIEEE
jgi:hypothetical protein